MPLHRSTWPDLLRLGWPVSATLLVRVTMRTVDLLVVGMVVGASGVAALGIGDAAARIVLMTALGLGAGTIATVSQRTGAGQRREADIAVTQSAVLALAVGLPFTVAGVLGAEAFFHLLGASDEVVDLGAPYLRIVLATAVPRMLAIMLTRAFQGTGDTRTPLVIRTIGTAVNIALTLLLVGGAGPFPELGVVGAAIGTAVGNVASAGLLLASLGAGERSLGFRRDGWWAPDTLRRIVSIGWPQVVERNLFALAAIPLNAIVLTFGTAANAGFQVGRRVQLYALLPSRGVATAASTFMGNRVGGRDPDAGDRYVRGGISLALVVSLAIGAPLMVFAPQVAGVFLSEPEALDFATTWVRVYLLVTVLRAVYGVLRGGMQGAGDTRSPLVTTATGIAVFMLGFSYVVGIELGFGLWAVYLGVALDPVLRLAWLYRRYDHGRWRRYLTDDAATEPSEATAS